MRLASSHGGVVREAGVRKGSWMCAQPSQTCNPSTVPGFCLVRPGSRAHTQSAQRRGLLQLCPDLPALQEVTGLCSVHSIPPKVSRWPLSPRSWSLMVSSEPLPQGWVASSLFHSETRAPVTVLTSVPAGLWKERPINKTILDAPGDPGMGLTWPLPPGSPHSRSGD